MVDYLPYASNHTESLVPTGGLMVPSQQFASNDGLRGRTVEPPLVQQDTTSVTIRGQPTANVVTPRPAAHPAIRPNPLLWRFFNEHNGFSPEYKGNFPALPTNEAAPAQVRAGLNRSHIAGFIDQLPGFIGYVRDEMNRPNWQTAPGTPAPRRNPQRNTSATPAPPTPAPPIIRPKNAQTTQKSTRAVRNSRGGLSSPGFSISNQTMFTGMSPQVPEQPSASPAIPPIYSTPTYTPPPMPLNTAPIVLDNNAPNGVPPRDNTRAGPPADAPLGTLPPSPWDTPFRMLPPNGGRP